MGLRGLGDMDVVKELQGQKITPAFSAYKPSMAITYLRVPENPLPCSRR
jgi:hypothetical protein